jgi:hypothetical protein
MKPFLYHKLHLSELSRLIWVPKDWTRSSLTAQLGFQLPWCTLLANHPDGEDAAIDVVLAAHVNYYDLIEVADS